MWSSAFWKCKKNRTCVRVTLSQPSISMHCAFGVHHMLRSIRSRWFFFFIFSLSSSISPLLCSCHHCDMLRLRLLIQPRRIVCVAQFNSQFVFHLEFRSPSKTLWFENWIFQFFCCFVLFCLTWGICFTFRLNIRQWILFVSLNGIKCHSVVFHIQTHTLSYARWKMAQQNEQNPVDKIAWPDFSIVFRFTVCHNRVPCHRLTRAHVQLYKFSIECSWNAKDFV